jgi:phage shock protein PspC (stress-responsive transcriptional regulator)
MSYSEPKLAGNYLGIDVKSIKLITALFGVVNFSLIVER